MLFQKIPVIAIFWAEFRELGHLVKHLKPNDLLTVWGSQLESNSQGTHLLQCYHAGLGGNLWRRA